MKIVFLFLVSTCVGFAQEQNVLYVFPGQGSDERLFSKLELEKEYNTRHIKYPIPEKGETMESFAIKLIAQIDTNEQYSFLGTSLGGMLAVELSQILSPEKTILISSAKSKKELPLRYRFQSKIPIYKLFTGRGLKTGARIMQPIVEPDRNVEKEIFKSMLKAKDSKYMKRTVAMITEWDREFAPKEIIHIHGDNDHTIPIKGVEATYIIEDGSHMITLTRPKEIKSILKLIL